MTATATTTTTNDRVGHMNPNDVVVLTKIMARNRDVPHDGGWVWVGGNPHGVRRANGSLGEVMHAGDSVYVCVQASDVLDLPNSHPDYQPHLGTEWVRLPKPSSIDWRYVPLRYHTRDGWRVSS